MCSLINLVFRRGRDTIFLPSPIALQGEKRGWLAVYVTLNELLVLLALLVQVAMFVWTIANDINNKK